MAIGPSSPLHRAIVLGVPLALGALEVGHPALLPGESIVATLAPMTVWWTVLHVLQIPLFALMGVATRLLVRDLPGNAARVARIAAAGFIVAYPAFDAAVGVSSGVAVHALRTAAPDRLDALEAALQPLFWGPVTGALALVGSACWIVALLAAAWAWRRAGAAWGAVAALALAGVLLGITHIRPIGPLACLCFAVGAAWITWRPPLTAAARPSA